VTVICEVRARGGILLLSKVASYDEARAAFVMRVITSNVIAPINETVTRLTWLDGCSVVKRFFLYIMITN